MKIESLIKREGGSFIDLPAPAIQYHFKPSEADPRHIAEVELKHHIAILLNIPNGFAAVDAEDDELPPPVELKSSVIHNASYPIHGGDNIELVDLVQMAFEQSALRVEEWNDLEDEQRYEYIDNTLADLQYDPSKPVEEEKPKEEPTPAEPVNASDVQVEEVSDQPAPPADPKPEQPEQEEKPKDAAEKPSDAPADKPAESGTTQTRDELTEAYKAKFGRKPSSLMTDANLAKAISEDDDE